MNYNTKQHPTMQTTSNSSLNGQQRKLGNITSSGSLSPLSQNLGETGQKSIEWAAGLFEGEGCITIVQGNKPQMFLRMTDEDVVQDFYNIVNVGKILGPYNTKNKSYYKAVYHWRLYKKKEIKHLIESLLPYLGVRRKQIALEALTFL